MTCDEERIVKSRLYHHKILWVLFFCSALLSGGCSTANYNFQINPYYDDTKAMVWPAPPEKPRIMYVGELTGEDNFKKRDEGGAMSGFLEVIAGVFIGDEMPVTLQRPQTGVVDENGVIYVTDVSRQAVFVFNKGEKGLVIWDMASKGGRFLSPVGVTLGDNGEILVTDSQLKVVVRLGPDGKPAGVIGKGRLKRPTGIARDPETGLIYVADTHDHNIKVFDYSGNLKQVIGHRGEDEGGLNYPTHIAFAGGRLYVTDTLNARVQIFDAQGGFIKSFGKRGLYKGEFTRPKGVGVDSDGNIYVVESFYDYLLVFDSQGRFLLPIGGTGSGVGQFYLPSGVWVDGHDRIFVSDMFNRRVVVFKYLGGS